MTQQPLTYSIPSAAPAWGLSEMLATVRCLSLGQIIEGPDRARFASRLAQSLGMSYVLPVNRARCAMELALRALGVSDNDEVILPTRAAAALGIGVEDVLGADPRDQVCIRYGESRLRVVGVLDTATADRQLEVSGEAIAPVDLYASGIVRSGVGERDFRNLVGTETNVRFMSYDRVVLLPYEFTMGLGGQIMSVAGRLQEGDEQRQRLEALMSRVEVNLFAAFNGTCHLVKTASSQSVEGLWKLIMPLLLVVLQKSKTLKQQ